MRLPNITSSNSIIQKIKELDQQRFKLDAQITSGQKIALPEDDGMRLGRVIQLETQKSQLTQYQRNASYAKEYLDAGYLNLDKLVELNQRGQEIARTAGSSLNGPAMETYGHEINQLIEEALNRVNSTHRKQALFGGTKLKPVFNNSDVQLGSRDQKNFLFNEIGSVGNDGIRRIKSGEIVSFSINGREYVVEAKVDGLSTDVVSSLMNDLINQDKGSLSESPSYNETNYSAFVRGGESDVVRNSSVKLNSELSNTGELIVYGTVGQSYNASANYTTKWDPNHYFPEQLDQKLNAEASSLYGVSSYENLGEAEKIIVRNNVEGSNWTRDLTVNQSKSDGTSTLEINHKENWRRLNIYKLGEVVEHEGRIFESIISDNVNHSPTNSGTDYWRELGSAYDIEREDWKLNVSGVKNQFYYSTPDGKLFSDQASATTHAQNILVASKTSEYQASNDPALAFATDLAASVKLVSIPVNEFSVDGSDSNATVFFNKETLDYELVAASKGGSIINSSFLKDNNQIFSVTQTFQNNDVVLHNGRYFLVQNANSVVADNLDFIEETLPPTGDVVKYSGQIPKLSSGAPISLKSGQYLHDDTNNSYYYVNQDLTLSADDITSIISNNTATIANTLPSPESLSSFNSSVHMAGDFISPDGLTTLVAADEMRGTFDPKKEYSIGDVVWNGTDGNGQGVYFEFGNKHLGEWNTGDAVTGGETVTYNGKLYQAQNNLTADQNIESKFSSGVDWQVVSDLSSLPNVVDVSNTVLNEATLDASITDTSTNKYFKLFDPNSNTISSSIPSGLMGVGYPPDNLILKKGQYLHDSLSDKYYAIKNDFTYSLTDTVDLDASTNANLVELNERSDGNVFLLGDSLPVEGKEHIYTTDTSLNAEKGDFVYDPVNDNFYVVKQTISKPADWTGGLPDYSLREGDFFSKIGSGTPSPRLAIQGEQWDSQNTYGIGQIVYNEGRYFQAQIDGTKGISPPTGASTNDNWIQVEESLNHILKFRVDNSKQPIVSIPSSGSAGVDAKADAIVDSEGRVVGLKVLDPGRYFFGSSTTSVSIPNNFQTAEVKLPSGETLKADVLWGVNPSDPGTYRVLGFELPTDAPREGTQINANVGDVFSFATGTKTFIDHRDENGNVVNITYTGSNQNSEYYVGNESKISGFLNAHNDGTKELGGFVQSLVDLRDALNNATPSHYSQEVEDEEKKLISQEEKLINKLGEISSKMVRMETVRAHDEDYFVQLDQRIARDVDIDLSEAIMRLTKLSTSYQAALQIGSQLLNTSLLNYL